MPVRKINLADIEMESAKEIQDGKPRHERCRRCFEDFHSEYFKSRRDECEERGYGILRCYDSPVTLGDAYGRDDWDEVEPEACGSCEEFDPRGLRFPLEVDDILFENPKLDKPLGHEIGELVAVRPCDPDFGNKTYLGILAGEIPVQIGLQYAESEKELRVYQMWSNPLIIIPSANAAVYGYESWWRPIESADDLSDITDEQIMSQPYMAALAKLYAEGDGAGN